MAKAGLGTKALGVSGFSISLILTPKRSVWASKTPIIGPLFLRYQHGRAARPHAAYQHGRAARPHAACTCPIKPENDGSSSHSDDSGWKTTRRENAPAIFKYWLNLLQ